MVGRAFRQSDSLPGQLRGLRYEPRVNLYVFRLHILGLGLYRRFHGFREVGLIGWGFLLHKGRLGPIQCVCKRNFFLVLFFRNEPRGGNVPFAAIEFLKKQLLVPDYLHLQRQALLFRKRFEQFVLVAHRLAAIQKVGRRVVRG